MRLNRCRQLLAQAREQHVSGEVAEAVVVALEPVEVEDRDQVPLPAHPPGRDPFEVAQQPAAVSEPGEGIRECLRLRFAKQHHVLLECKDHPDDDEQRAMLPRARSRGPRPARSGRRPSTATPPSANSAGSTSMRRVAEAAGRVARPASSRPPRSPLARRARECRAMTPPCSRPSPPAEGRRHRRIATTTRPPPSRAQLRSGRHPLRATAATTNDDEQEIAERVGEVDGDRRRVPVGAALEGRIQERGPDRGDRERADQPIEPAALLEPVQTHVGEQREAGVERGISAM